MRTIKARKANIEGNEYYLAKRWQPLNPARKLVGKGTYIDDHSSNECFNFVSMKSTYGNICVGYTRKGRK